MIASLTGILEDVGEDSVVVEVNGVGYLLYCSARTLAGLPRRGEAVAFKVETHVREDHIHLYGFAGTGERAWFRHLTTVQGVGARVALAILSVLSPAELSAAVASGDKSALVRASGVGPKLAQRILAELADRVGADAFAVAVEGAGLAPAAGAVDPAFADAVSALANLGYGRSEAFAAVAQAAREVGAGASVEALIRAGLVRLGAPA